MNKNNQPLSESDKEKSRLLISAIYPVLFVLLLWLVKAFEELSGLSLSRYGLAPKSFAGLIGIFTYPFLHKDFSHLISNSLPLLVLATALIYYYRPNAFIIFLQLFFISGFWLWVIGARGSVHIGASGLVYGLTAFHFATGIIKRNLRQMAFAILVVFLYGSMVWGIFPGYLPDKNISWEGHLMGMLAGLVLAWFHRHEGPARDHYEWEDEDVGVDEAYEEEEDVDGVEIEERHSDKSGPERVSDDTDLSQTGQKGVANQNVFSKSTSTQPGEHIQFGASHTTMPP